MTPSDISFITRYFQNQPDVHTVFLFGSRARGRARSTSDIDLAVLLAPTTPEETHLEKRLQFMGDLSQSLGAEPDVILLNEAGPVLIHQVLQHGKLLYEKDRRLTNAFKARAMIDYVDWLPYKTRLDQSVLKHFRSPHGR